MSDTITVEIPRHLYARLEASAHLEERELRDEFEQVLDLGLPELGTEKPIPPFLVVYTHCTIQGGEMDGDGLPPRPCGTCYRAARKQLSESAFQELMDLWPPMAAGHDYFAPYYTNG